MGYSGIENFKPKVPINKKNEWEGHPLYIEKCNLEREIIRLKGVINHQHLIMRNFADMDKIILDVEELDGIREELKLKEAGLHLCIQKLKEAKRMSVTNQMYGETTYPFGINIGNIITINDTEQRKYESLDSWLDIPDHITIECLSMYGTANGSKRIIELHDAKNIVDSKYKLCISTKDTKAKSADEVLLFERHSRASKLTSRNEFNILEALCGDGYIHLNWERDGVDIKRTYSRTIEYDKLDTKTTDRVINHKLVYNAKIAANASKEYKHDWIFQFPTKTLLYFTELIASDDLRICEVLEFEEHSTTWSSRSTSNGDDNYITIWVGVKLNPHHIKGIQL